VARVHHPTSKLDRVASDLSSVVLVFIEDVTEAGKTEAADYVSEPLLMRKNLGVN
jgi:hypothetical protein